MAKEDRAMTADAGATDARAADAFKENASIEVSVALPGRLAVYDPENRAGTPPQPTPSRVGIRPIESRGEVVAVVLDREWPPGTTGPRGGCRLCERCVARNGRCVVIACGPDAARLDAIEPKIDNEVGMYSARRARPAD